MSVAVIIGFRDRGTDPLRAANLTRVLEWWSSFNADLSVVTDGRSGDQQFNRHQAYNRAAQQTDADILAFVESDMLIDFTQIDEAIKQATETPGLVVPFTERHELSPDSSELVRAHTIHPRDGRADVIKPKPKRTGAINILSRATLEAVGQYDPAFEGNWWDDRSMHIAFDICAGPTRWIDGPSWHLHHLPGHEGTHLTPEDKAATARNRERWQQYTQATTPDQIRRLTTGHMEVFDADRS
jgi:hypothetical protein